MARMHGRARGRSSSNRPLIEHKPTWLKYTSKEVEMLISKLAKEDNSASQIGIILRDSYGIPDVRLVTKKKISEILEAKKLRPELPDDMTALIAKAARVRKHLDILRKDTGALRGLQLTESKIRRLAAYHKKAARIPINWKYVAEEHKAAAQ